MNPSFLLLFVFFISTSLFAQRQKIDPISFGIVTLGEDRMPIDLNTFKIHSSGKYNIQGKMVQDTLQWIRLDKTVLVPRALMEVSFKGGEHFKYSFEYAHQRIIPLFDKMSGKYKARIFISLFEALPLQLYEDDQVANTIRIIPESKERSHLIDYSCAPYSIKITGAKKDYLSLGCKVQRTGKFGEEKVYLEILLTSASYRLKDDSEPPYLVLFHESGEAKISMINNEGHEEIITIAATLPKKIPRFKIAGGFGPYSLTVQDDLGNKKYEIAPTVMLYGNFSLNDTSSLRFFDSYSKNTSTFHNWGVYYAWDLASLCDQRCILTSLIGAQGLDYRYSSNRTFQSETIYPQGFEFVYKHPFGNLNYKMSYGMFIGLSGLYNYTNAWLRYGKNYFWEINYIEWQQNKQGSSMFGISVGLPLAQFF